MKRCLLLFSLLIFLTINAVAGSNNDFRMGIEAGYFSVEDGSFNNLYGSGAASFGLNSGYFLSDTLEISSSLNYFSKEGKTSFTKETITLTLFDVRLGGFFHFNPEDIDPKIGIGLDLCFVNEENPFENFSNTQIGWFITAGIEMPVSSGITIGLDIIYNSVTVQGDLGDVDLGGISALGLFKISF